MSNKTSITVTEELNCGKSENAKEQHINSILVEKDDQQKADESSLIDYNLIILPSAAYNCRIILFCVHFINKGSSIVIHELIRKEQFINIKALNLSRCKVSLFNLIIYEQKLFVFQNAVSASQHSHRYKDVLTLRLVSRNNVDLTFASSIFICASATPNLCQAK